VRLEIDLGVLRENYRKIAAAVAPCAVIAVVKANAYGLGVRRVAGALSEAGVARFGLADLNEARELIDIGPPVQILGGLLPEEIPDAVRLGVVLPITDLDTAQAISRESVAQGTTARCHVLVDTGMGRLGILAQEAESVIREAVELPNLDCEGIYSHFPVGYRPDDATTFSQISDFVALLDRLESTGITFDFRHIANSGAINNFPQTCKPPFNAVRPGINLYGLFNIEGKRALDLEPILTLKTRLTAVRRLPAGMTVGYGCTYRLRRATRVGTISAGYADGVPLALSNRGHVLVRGRRCPVVGRVSMDYTTVDLDAVPDARHGDEVICLGGEGPDAISVQQWAELKGTHSYEIICSLGSRVERCYVGSQ